MIDQNFVAEFLKNIVPIYSIVILIEMTMSYIHQKHYYTKADTITNIYLSALNFLLDFLMKGYGFLILSYFSTFSFFKIENQYLYWIVLLFAEDFMFYWEHRIDHYSRLFWAVHVTHHSSDKFNLTTGFRSSVFQPLYRFVYFIPLALCGFEFWHIMFMYSATQIYGILIHTSYINNLGFLEYFMSTPSHHRVHHASNIKYLDKNMGMVFIIWDKLFGTFEPENNCDEPIKYGLTKPIEHKHYPTGVVLHEWKALWNDLKRPLPIYIKLKYIFMPPGWSHDGSSLTSKQLREQLKNKK
jgi:sterol desaturase/sphingolipid hydroxylase (fatty acid hydroxylase superfamily)